MLIPVKYLLESHCENPIHARILPTRRPVYDQKFFCEEEGPRKELSIMQQSNSEDIHHPFWRNKLWIFPAKPTMSFQRAHMEHTYVVVLLYPEVHRNNYKQIIQINPLPILWSRTTNTQCLVSFSPFRSREHQIRQTSPKQTEYKDFIAPINMKPK